MAALHSFALYLLHAVYSLLEILFSSFEAIFRQLFRGRQGRNAPASFERLPKHLAVVFRSHGRSEPQRHDEDVYPDTLDTMIGSSQRVLRWAAELGVEQVTLYDRNGLLKNHLQNALTTDARSTASVLRSSESTLARSGPSRRRGATPDGKEGYLTPPVSDASSDSSVQGSMEEEGGGGVLSFRYTGPSLSLLQDEHSTTTTLRRRRHTHSHTKEFYTASTLRVNVIDSSDGLPAIARTAKDLALSRSSTERSIRIADLDERLLGALSAPDLLLVHQVDRCPPSHLSAMRHLDAFPPWQLRLTEIQFPKRSSRSRRRDDGERDSYWIEREDLDRALAEYSKAEMREGK